MLHEKNVYNEIERGTDYVSFVLVTVLKRSSFFVKMHIDDMDVLLFAYKMGREEELKMADIAFFVLAGIVIVSGIINIVKIKNKKK